MEHPDRYYSDYEMSRPVIRSFQMPEFDADFYDDDDEDFREWQPYWDPLTAPFMIRPPTHYAPYVPRPFEVPEQQEPTEEKTAVPEEGPKETEKPEE